MLLSVSVGLKCNKCCLSKDTIFVLVGKAVKRTAFAKAALPTQKTTERSLKSKGHGNPCQTFMAMCQNRPKERSKGRMLGRSVHRRIYRLLIGLARKKMALPVGQSRRDDYANISRSLIGPDLR